MQTRTLCQSWLSARDTELLRSVPIGEVSSPSISPTAHAHEIDDLTGPTQMDLIRAYLQREQLPEDREEARRIKYHLAKYMTLDDKLYRRGYSTPLLRCLITPEATPALEEVHAGICGDHSSGQALTSKLLRHNYYWPNLKADSFEYAQKCDKCQRYAKVTRAPSEELTTTVNSISFY